MNNHDIIYIIRKGFNNIMLKFFTRLLNAYTKVSYFLRVKTFFTFSYAVWMILLVWAGSGIIGYLKIEQLYPLSRIAITVSFFIMYAIIAPYTSPFMGNQDLNTINIIKTLSTKSYLYSMVDIIVTKLGLFILSIYIIIYEYFPFMTKNILIPFYVGFILYTIIYFTYHIANETVELDEIEILLKLYLLVNSCVSSILLIFNIINLKILVAFFTTTYTGLSYMIAEKRKERKLRDTKILLYHEPFLFKDEK